MCIRDRPSSVPRSPRSRRSCRCWRDTPTWSWTTWGRQSCPASSTSGPSSSNDARTSPASTRSYGDFWGSRQRCVSIATGPCSCVQSQPRLALTASTRCGPLRRPCRCPNRSRPRWPGSSACTADRQRPVTGPHRAIAATRLAVRKTLGEIEQVHPGALVLVACSGGADSLALAAAVAFEAPRAGLSPGAVIVDHDLQEGSLAVAERAADQCRGLGLEPVEIVTVQVWSSGGGHGNGDGVASGPEARARDARYSAFEDVAERVGAVAVLLGHTRDDQAEQVLLGLARGSGARSLSGMPARRGPYVRPLLGVARATTVAACEAAGLTAWVDPHNSDPAYGRVRARALLPVLETELGPGAVAALARSADLLREDADALDDLATEARGELGRPGPRLPGRRAHRRPHGADRPNVPVPQPLPGRARSPGPGARRERAPDRMPGRCCVDPPTP